MGSVEDAIAKRIGVVGVTDGGVPLLDGKLSPVVIVASVALALILDPSGGFFSDAARPCQRPAPPFGANVALENRD